jgi:hypothetical protein
MGFGRAFKKFTGNVGLAVSEATGSRAVGRATTIGLTTGLGLAYPLAGTGSSAYSDAEKRQTAQRGALQQAEIDRAQAEAKNAEIANQARLALMAQEDLKAMQEQERKRTTFAGSSIQGLQERKMLFGV